MNNTHGDILHNTTDAIYRTKPEELTGGKFQQPCNNYHLSRGEVGWICPVCGRGLAPSTSYCPCNLNNNLTWENDSLRIRNVVDCGITATPESYYHTTATSKSN